MSVIDQVTSQPSILTEQVRDVAIEPDSDGGIRVSAWVTADAANPILAGHYPGWPIVPGVCVIECVHRTVLAAARQNAVTPVLEAIVSARFLDATFPGDTIEIRTRITIAGQQWTATAVVRGERGPTAKIRLRYRLMGGAS